MLLKSAYSGNGNFFTWVKKVVYMFIKIMKNFGMLFNFYSYMVTCYTVLALI